jgi:transcriptional regulator with XRE-family HTH domain
MESLRDLVLRHAARRGWHTQRHVAVISGLDESALSRFLNGEQDIGARRTHALFQTVGIPVEEYDLAYALLGRAQDDARQLRHGRQMPATAGARPNQAAVREWSSGGMRVERKSNIPASMEEMPAAVVVALFAARGYTGEQIADFFAP